MKAVCLLSGGIDSPVAAQIAISNGFTSLFLLHYHNYPFQSFGTLEKVVALSNILAKNNPEINIALAIMYHGKTQELILNNLEGREIRQTCLFCRIQMFSKAQSFAGFINADAIITGEILGEQASQTLDNLPIVTSKVQILALRPLIGYNKEEVVRLSKEWGYYETSILPGGCCSINPKYPETKGRLEVLEPIYKLIYDEIEKISKKELENVKIYSLPTNIEDILREIDI